MQLVFVLHINILDYLRSWALWLLVLYPEFHFLYAFYTDTFYFPRMLLACWLAACRLRRATNETQQEAKTVVRIDTDR